MDRSPSRTVDSQETEGRRLRADSGRPWPSIWAAFAVVLVVAAADYLTMFMNTLLPLWAWCVTGGGLVLALALVAVFVEVASARRARGRRRIDLVAQVSAAALVGVWLWLLWGLLARGCLDQECEPVSLWRDVFVLVPVVPLSGLTLIGYLVRRGTRGLDR